jgi:hypothetical protein
MVIMQAYKQEDGKYTVAVTVSKAYYEHTEIDVAI